MKFTLTTRDRSIKSQISGQFIALIDPKLSVFTGEEDEIHSYDERPQHKITNIRFVDPKLSF